MATLSPALALGEQAADPNLRRIRDLVYQVAGIFQPESKFYYLADRCGRRMKVVGIGSYRDYLQYLTASPYRETELRQLLNEITVGETCFFRNQPQLDALRTVVLPSVTAEKARWGFNHLRIWSAGCSTGEEPYTLAMILMEEIPRALKGWTFEVVAHDLNDRSLAKAREATYTDYSMRHVSDYYRQKYFIPRNKGLSEVRDEVKARVSFSRMNLHDNSKMLFMKGMDIIFCCNVLIYFDGDSKRRTIQHFYNNLLPSGYFFLGHSESLFGVNDDFRLVHFPGTTGYRKFPVKTGAAK